MSPSRLTTVLVATVCGFASGTAATTASDHPHYEIAASLSSAEHRVEGTLTVRLVNTTNVTLSDAVFVSFANRFASADELVDDYTRPFVYPVRYAPDVLTQ